MIPSELPSRHCYSVRLVRPFIRLLQKYPGFPAELLQPLADMDPDERLPITAMHELLRGAEAMTGDPDLGLKAAREIDIGDYGALEYAASSASSVRESLEVIRRYLHLVNDALETSMEIEGDRAVIRLKSAIVLTRASNDFQSAAFYWAARQRGFAHVPNHVVCFSHPKPADTSQYALTFPDASVLFEQPFDGSSFDAAFLDMKLPTADPKLHEVIRKHAEQMLTELPRTHSFTESVRLLVTRELTRGDPGAEHIAKLLHMSSRTLARRLEDEGTTFKDLVEELRRSLALRYIGGRDLDIAEVAFLLGFSDASSFYRAFKRWTGQTPLAYRKQHRG